MHEVPHIALQSSDLLRWIPLLPLIGSGVNFLLGAGIQKRFGRAGVAAIACAASIASFVLVAMSFFDLKALPVESRTILDSVMPWIQVGSLHVDIAFQFDPLSAVMTLVVTFVGSIIHIYSYGYMDDEPSAWRYFALLNLFMFSMLTLVLGDNLLVMFVGWEGVGLCSWGLIGFWYSNLDNARAGNKAFIVNRIGDFGFILGVFALFWSLDSSGHGTLVFRDLAANASHLQGMMIWGLPVATVVTLLLFVGATGKSAQIPLYIWLPDAMAGPTPVSALIHAATMVTASVYMIGRLNFLFSMAPLTLEVVAYTGAATAFFAATIGLAQNDIKKVLAYSTVSQLGYMFMGMGVGAYAAGIFHLMTHAFFKACLFLGSGSIIHAMHHEQDMRNMGGLRRYMPITFLTFLLATLAISGIPGTAGFFSKDEILWRSFLYDRWIWAIGFVAAGMTAFYMFRQVFMTFFGECRADEHVKEHLHESSGWMTVPLIVLALGAVFAGYIGVPSALGGSNRFEQWLEPVMGHERRIASAGHAVSGSASSAAEPGVFGVSKAVAADGASQLGVRRVAETLQYGEHAEEHGAGGAEHENDGHGGALEYGLMAASVGIGLLGILLAYLIYGSGALSAEWFTSFAGGVPYKLIYNKYYIDEIYYGSFLAGTIGLSRVFGWFDRTVVDGLVNGAAAITRMASWINGAVDAYIVDGLVNLTANVVRRIGGGVRRLQTGSINGYLYVLIGVVAAVLLARVW